MSGVKSPFVQVGYVVLAVRLITSGDDTSAVAVDLTRDWSVAEDL